MRKPFPRILLITFVCAVASRQAGATESADCSLAAVRQAAQTALGASGDWLVEIKEGTCDWGGDKLEITLPVPTGTTAKVFALKGKAVASQTQIIRSTTPSATPAAPLISIDCRNLRTSDRIQVSDLTLVGMGNDRPLDGGLRLANGCIDFQVFRSRFEKFGGSGVVVGGGFYDDLNHVNQPGYISRPRNRGVIYRNEFIDNYSQVSVGFPAPLGYGVLVIGKANEWQSIALGTKEAVVVEDNLFRGNRHDIAAQWAAVYVFRHNVVVDNRGAAVDAHGFADATHRGTRAWEVYDNIIYQSKGLMGNVIPPPAPSVDNRNLVGIWLNGGEGVIYRNKIVNARFAVALGTPNSQNCATRVRIQDDPTNVWVWNNGTPLPFIQMWGYSGGPPENTDVCRTFFVEGIHYNYAPKPGYTPLNYPHYLRLGK